MSLNDRYDNHFIHPHHEVLCDYTHRLNNEYETLPRRWIDYFLVRISNLLRDAFHFRNAYPITYNPSTMVLTMTGFPTYDLKRRFDFVPYQVEYALHKLDYKQALLYKFGKTWVKAEFYPTKPSNEDCVKIIHMTEEQYNLEEELIDCNILTSPSNRQCTCCCCHKEEDEEGGVSDEMSEPTSPATGNTTGNTSEDTTTTNSNNTTLTP